jgi:hypothetical protein
MVNGLIRVSLETVRADHRRQQGARRFKCVVQGLACTLTAIVEILLFLCSPKSGLHFAPSFILGKGMRSSSWIVRGATLTVPNSVFEHTHGLTQLARRPPPCS